MIENNALRSKTATAAGSPPPAAVDATGVCGAPQIFEIIAEEHALQRELCDLLELIADGLPHTFDRARAAVVVSMLGGAIPSHTRLEEQALFPILLKRLPSGHPVAAAIGCLTQDHEHEHASLIELTEALGVAIAGTDAVNMEALGYLLRGQFEALRRHLDFEDQVVMPAARLALTADDLAMLQDWIMRSAHPRCCRQSLMTLRLSDNAQALCGRCPDGLARLV